MRQPVGAMRLIVAVLSAIAVIVTLNSSVAAGQFRFFDFFGYFTIQGNLICVVVFAVVGIAGLTGRGQSTNMVLARAAATTYIVIVGVVYNTLLTSADVGVLVPWANAVLHIVLPLYAAIDWVLFGDRKPIAWSRLPLVLVYPIVWTGVVLIRQAVEGPGGWVPYPFLNVAKLGVGVVGWIALIAAAFILVGALVWWLSRFRALKL